jgi:hypothetical protein
MVFLGLAFLFAGLMVVASACTQETHITGPDCFAKADASGGAGGAGSATGEGGAGSPGTSSASSGCSGAGVQTK